MRDTIWQAFEPLIPLPVDTHPLGVDRGRTSDRDRVAVIVVRLATGCSLEDAERLCHNKVSDTTARDRRDEWVTAGVVDAVVQEGLSAYDRIIGLDLREVAVDGSLHKSPCGGEGTGKNPNDRAKLGWRWSILTEATGIPIGWSADGANRSGSVLLAPTLDSSTTPECSPAVASSSQAAHSWSPWTWARKVRSCSGLQAFISGVAGLGGSARSAGLRARWPRRTASLRALWSFEWTWRTDRAERGAWRAHLAPELLEGGPRRPAASGSPRRSSAGACRPAPARARPRSISGCRAFGRVPASVHLAVGDL